MIELLNKTEKMFGGLGSFLLLWITQSFSAFGSAMTSFAFVIWSYEKQGSALTTALLSICSYAPYVILSIFAGALSDRWNKKITMLICDSFAAVTTVFVFVLLRMGVLEIWHLYILNGLNGLMNTVQQPSSDVAVSLLVPKKYYHRISGMRAFSNSLVTVLTPICAAAILSFAGIEAVIFFDLFTFSAAFLSLAFLIRIPSGGGEEREAVMKAVRSGLEYLRNNRGILDLILFLAAVNFIASMYEAALPAMLLSREEGGRTALGLVNMCAGLANVAGSILVSFSQPPKSRIKVICNGLLFSMGTENFFLAFGKSIPVWCSGAFLGWLFIPFMNASMDVVFRETIPVSMQGRVYSARNTLQFFTIPLGYFMGGFLTDCLFEPMMRRMEPGSFMVRIFGEGKGSGAAVLFFFLACTGVLVCLIFRRDRHIWNLEKKR